LTAQFHSGALLGKGFKGGFARRGLFLVSLDDWPNSVTNCPIKRSNAPRFQHIQHF
jgi:hypothetical protein